MAAHLYWRLDFGSTPSFVALASVQMRTTPGGANVCTGGTPSANSSSGTAANAFDTNTATYWESSGSALPNWIQYRFASAQDIVEFTLLRYSGFPGEVPSTIALKYSDDGTTFTTLKTFTPDEWTAQAQTFSVADIPKSYWRLNVSATQGASSSAYVSIAELQMRTTQGGANVCTGGASKASSLYTQRQSGEAFDNNSSTYWESNGSPVPSWIYYHFAAQQNIVEYVIQASTQFVAETPKSWTLEYSSDGVTWTVADTRTGAPTWTAGESRTYSVTSAASAARLQQFIVM